MQTRRFQDFEITDDPIEPIGRTEQKKDDLTLGFKLGHIGNRGAIREIERLIQKYPKDPAFRNYLVAAYSHSGKIKKAIIANNELLKTHPGYLFARTNGVVHLLNEKNPNFAKVRELLKLEDGKVSLKAMNADRNVFHYSEVAAYYSAVGVYNVRIGDEDGAEKMLEILLNADLSEHPMTLDLTNRIITSRFEKNISYLNEGKEKEIAVDSFPTVIFEEKETPPTLIHEELNAFYTTDLDNLDETVQQKIMALPRETLVKDLVNILEDSIHRFEYMKMHYSDDDWDVSEASFAMHSLFFLGALKVEEAFQSILNLLRQGDEFIEWWYSDYFVDYYKPTLFALGKNKVSELKAFLLEPNIAYRAKNIIAEVLAQVVLHDESRREEVLDVYREVILGITKNENDKTQFDTVFLTLLVGSLIDIKAVELLPEIENLYKKEWVTIYVQGTLENVEQEIILPIQDYRIDPQPENVAEFYSRAYEERRVKSTMLPDLLSQSLNPKAQEFIGNMFVKSLLGGGEKEDGFSTDDDDYSPFFDDNDDTYTDYTESVETVRRESPKVNRNAPCPCGSGKKYKKCCWNK